MQHRHRLVVVFAALALTRAASAQCGYQNTSPQCFSFAPPATEVGNLGEDLHLRSERLKITGDLRVRTRVAHAPATAPYATGDQITHRARVNMDYQLNENANAFVQFNSSETWAGGDGYSDAQPGETYNGIGQAYLLTRDVFGAGETMRVGRSTFTLASGLIYGSCDFLQYPAAGTGLWLSRAWGENALELFTFDNDGTQTAQATGARFYGGTGRIDLHNQFVRALEPYVMIGTDEGNVDNDDEWYGVTAGGSIGKSGEGAAFLNWSAEAAQREMGATDRSNNAYRVVLSKDFRSLTRNVLESLSLTYTDADGAMHVNPADFNTAGLLHRFGGAWRSDLTTYQAGISLQPVEALDLELTYVNFDANGDHNNEVDLMAGTKLRNGVHGWVGYGRDEEDREVFYAQLTMFF
ncbi:MAG: hypothetical protein IT454_07240 [Planctomycetes bacterium]|nr:hypothetical protein [Planctomycetota bacterium]